MAPRFRQIPKDSHSHLIEVAANIWTLEGNNCIYFRPPAQPSYPMVICGWKGRVCIFFECRFRLAKGLCRNNFRDTRKA